ncbi:hypothetical protein CAPN010_10260 [Capnocytophaga cynodegmi]|nr:hypothetical protein CAPN010_10260 [Capnocytophaga cynodegmi]
MLNKEIELLFTFVFCSFKVAYEAYLQLIICFVYRFRSLQIILFLKLLFIYILNKNKVLYLPRV